VEKMERLENEHKLLSDSLLPMDMMVNKSATSVHAVGTRHNTNALLYNQQIALEHLLLLEQLHTVRVGRNLNPN
jgi:hypothetical protein